MHMKETADLILRKEQGIAEMVGDYAKLQAQFRNEVEQKVGRCRPYEASSTCISNFL